MSHPRLKASVRITSSSASEGSIRLQVGSFAETGLVLEGPAYLPHLLFSLDGRNDEGAVLGRLSDNGHRPNPGEVRELVRQLIECGLVDAPSAPTSESTLTQEQEGRYYKHLLFYEMFHDSARARKMQAALALQKVALIGMGGIGSVAAYLLAAAGVGRLVGADPDSIEASNLTRQVLYRTADVGRTKVAVAAERLKEHNPYTVFEARSEVMTCAQDIRRVVEGCDLAILSADQPAALASWMNQACIAADVPFTSSGYSGHIAVCGPLVVPGKTACLACAGEPPAVAAAGPAVDAINARHAVPSFGPINHLSASLACMEALKYLTGVAAPETLGTRLLFDPMRFASRRVSVAKRDDCPVCSAHDRS